MGKIRRHAVRCFEGKTTTYDEQDDVVIQHAGTAPYDDLIEPDGILWTGAIERDRRMIAVLTFYRQASQQVSTLELTALRQIRGLVSEAVRRIHDTVEMQHRLASSESRERGAISDVVTTRIRDADLMSKAFGPAHVTRLQGSMIHALSAAFPRAFMIARIGHDQVIIITHAGDGMTLGEWSEAIRFACQHIRVSDNASLNVDIELGEVQGVGSDQDPMVKKESETVIEAPRRTTPGAIAG